jgi:hypothetical protein
LFGQLESLVWLEAQGFASLLDPVALAALPRQLFLLVAVAVVLAGLVALLWRPLHLLCFDPDYAAAIGLPDPAKGELPIAFVQLKPGAQATPDELMELCRREVQERAAIPVSITVIEQMPMTAVGKISKPVLRFGVTKDVATKVAAEALGGSHGFSVTVDEKGARPVAEIRITGPHDGAVAQKLAEAFKTYEFATQFTFTGV